MLAVGRGTGDGDGAFGRGAAARGVGGVGRGAGPGVPPPASEGVGSDAVADCRNPHLRQIPDDVRVPPHLGHGEAIA